MFRSTHKGFAGIAMQRELRAMNELRPFPSTITTFVGSPLTMWWMQGEDADICAPAITN